jgi:quinol-cytochrome oxidoreductase complex cytochrome b subunit
MFDAHVLLIPLGLAALLYAHIALFESHGIAPPATSDPLQRRRFTEREGRTQVPFMPHILFYIGKWGLLYTGLLFGIAALWPWNLPTYVGNLAVSPGVTEPDWYFLWVFKLVDFQGVTPVIAVGATTAILLYILFVPFLDRSKRTHPRDRPVFIWAGTSLLAFFVVMTVWGGETPGIEILPTLVAQTLGPIFAVNALAVGLFHWRYVRSYRRRLAARGDAPTGAYPSSGARSPGALPPTEATVRE